ncbi:unnamed protein product, partial [Rotaria magnacalcarata]
MSGAAVIISHNRYRQSANLAPLAASQRLRNAAQSHANHMAQTRQIWSAVAENVAAEQTTINQVMTTWMNSPGHRDNILNGNYKRIGVGISRGADNL